MDMLTSLALVVVVVGVLIASVYVMKPQKYDRVFFPSSQLQASSPPVVRQRSLDCQSVATAPVRKKIAFSRVGLFFARMRCAFLNGLGASTFHNVSLRKSALGI